MKPRALASLALVAAALLPTGCATVLISAHNGELEPYLGTRADAFCAWGGHGGGALSLATALDLPLSFVADTLLLPVALPMSLAR